MFLIYFSDFSKKGKPIAKVGTQSHRSKVVFNHDGWAA